MGLQQKHENILYGGNLNQFDLPLRSYQIWDGETPFSTFYTKKDPAKRLTKRHYLKQLFSY